MVIGGGSERKCKTLSIQYLLGLPPYRRELVFDTWARVKRDPNGEQRDSIEIASAIVEMSRATAAAQPGRTTSEVKVAPEKSLNWYRRYRLPVQKRGGSHRAPRHRGTPMQIKSIVAQMSAS